MRSKLVIIGAVLMMLLAACSADSAEVAATDTNVTQTAIQSIVDELNAEADASSDPARAAVRVTYGERVDHFDQFGAVHYGIHYIVMVATDGGSDLETDAIAEDIAGRIFEMTTEQVFSTNRRITHMGVQITEADFWMIGGHEIGAIHIYVGGRDDLEGVARDADATPADYLFVTSQDRLTGGGWDSQR